MNKVVILISGKKRTGKDTVANIIANALNKHFTPRIVHYADAMKNILATSLGISRQKFDQFKENNAKIKLDNENVCNIRELLQHFGTDAMQATFGKEIWVTVVKNIIQADNFHKVFIIPDFRFKHEDLNEEQWANYLKSEKDIDLHVIRVRVNSNVYNDDEHISEVDLDNYSKFDYVITNNKNVSNKISDSVYSDCANVVNETLECFSVNEINK